VEQTAKALDIQQYIKVVNADVFKFIERSFVKYDFIFADPPFQMPAIDTLPTLVFDRNMLSPGGWFVLEHNGLHDFQQHPRFQQQRHYGGTYFTFFEMPGDDQTEEE
jgi:16S rRNA G966 N2-methylase RsmD